MATTTVHAGICGFVTRVTAVSGDEQHVTIALETGCDKVQKLGKALPVLDAYAEIQAGHDGELMKAVRASMPGCCAGCAVPAGVYKSMQVAAGLALPGNVTMEISGD